MSDKKQKLAEIKVQKILHKIQTLKLSDCYVLKLNLKNNDEFLLLNVTRKFWYLLCVLAVIILSLVLTWIYIADTNQDCLIEVPSAYKSAFRPPESCDMCATVRDVARLSNLSAHEFQDSYAYSTQPVIVTDATKGWRAMKEFSYDFFKRFYQDTKMGYQINNCFYFPYKSGLDSLQDVFNMDESRANLSGQPWYVGWSTCYDEETRKLRSYYSRPYFLPKTAESDMVDWIFMGGPGQGAHMHVDSVKHMSWQAQIRGRKQWELAPPPECIYSCVRFTFVVEPGDIVVIDTNRWYHRTNVLPGDISITIGAEYD